MRDVSVILNDGRHVVGLLTDYDPVGGNFTMQIDGQGIDIFWFRDVKSAVVSVPYTENLASNWDFLLQATLDGWNGT